MSRPPEPLEIDPPPEPPELARRLRIPGSHLLGLAVLGMIVLLAALGVFGESWTTTSARTDALALSVQYATKFRYKQIDALRVHVTNRSDRRIDTLTVAFDPSYISRFSSLIFTPAAVRAWEVELTDVGAGETRRVHVEIQGERYGRHTGAVSAWFAGSDTVAAELSTMIFP